MGHAFYNTVALAFYATRTGIVFFYSSFLLFVSGEGQVQAETAHPPCLVQQGAPLVHCSWRAASLDLPDGKVEI